MFRLRLVPETTNIKFVSFRKASFLLSSLFAICSVVLFAVIGLNYGIDFRGGTMIEIGTEGPADLTRIRTIASSLGLGDVQVQSFGEENDVLIRVEQQSGGEKAQQNVVATLRAALDREYGSPISYRRVEVVGP
ncbi:MAG TPA: protein translocase subunit SecF, partial [Alphaproteobacteria bacterium]|nr:protein translocase subunit SecF [Alphaproteobacteria bacterium]